MSSRRASRTSDFSHDELVRRLVEEFDAQVLDDDQEDS